MLQAVNVIWEELVSFLNCDQQNKNKPFASVIRYIWNDCFCYGSISFRFYPKQHKNGPNFLLIEDIWCILLLKLPLNILWWFLWTISRAGRSLSPHVPPGRLHSTPGPGCGWLQFDKGNKFCDLVLYFLLSPTMQEHHYRKISSRHQQHTVSSV